MSRKQIKQTALNYITMEWLTPLMYKGALKPLQAEDLLEIADKDKAGKLSHILDGFWDSYYSVNDSKDRAKLNLFIVFAKSFGLLFLVGALFQGISIACALSIPKFIQQVILYLTPYYPRDKLWLSSGVEYAFCIFALQVGTTIFGRTAEQIIRTLEQNVRTILIGTIYEKSLRMSLKSSGEFTQGRILNLINGYLIMK